MSLEVFLTLVEEQAQLVGKPIRGPDPKGDGVKSMP